MNGSCNSAENYNCWISRMGEVDISTANLPDEQQVLICQQYTQDHYLNHRWYHMGF